MEFIKEEKAKTLLVSYQMFMDEKLRKKFCLGYCYQRSSVLLQVSVCLLHGCTAWCHTIIQKQKQRTVARAQKQILKDLALSGTHVSGNQTFEMPFKKLGSDDELINTGVYLEVHCLVCDYMLREELLTDEAREGLRSWQILVSLTCPCEYCLCFVCVLLPCDFFLTSKKWQN